MIRPLSEAAERRLTLPAQGDLTSAGPGQPWPPLITDCHTGVLEPVRIQIIPLKYFSADRNTMNV